MTKKYFKNDTNRRLSMQADRQNRALDETSRKPLRAEITESSPPAKLAKAIRARFASLGGVDLEIPPRGPMREPPDCEKHA